MRSQLDIAAVLVISVAVAGCATTQPFHPNIAAGGRAVSIAVNPTNVQDIIVASESGGAFRTANAGATWTWMINLPSHMVTDIAYAPGDANILIATAALVIPSTAVDFRTAAVPIWRSTDGGETWQQPAGSLPVDAAACPARVGAYSVSFASDATNVYVGTDCGLAISPDRGATWSHKRLNAAAEITPEKAQNRIWSVLAAGGGRVYAAAADGVWSSSDAGASWTRWAAGVTGQDWVTHALATSPFDRAQVFLVTWRNQLIFSRDAGTTWFGLPGPTTQVRPAFVRTARAVSGAANQFDVYFGDGVVLHRQTFTHAPGGPTGSTWTPLTTDHADPADIAFDPAGRTPVLLATDGGVHRTTDNGASWTLSGGGKGGFNALQITEVTGEEVASEPPHRDLYFGTQDNDIRGSQDDGATWPHVICCEGFYLSAPPLGPDHIDRTISGVWCSPCSNFFSAAHLIAPADFPNAPDGDSNSGDVDANPFLIQVPDYIQNTVNNDAAVPVNTFKLTDDRGVTWRTSFTISDEVRGIPHQSGSLNSPTIYHAVRRPGTFGGALERMGLVKVTDVYSTGGTVVPADGGLGSLGLFTTQFAWYVVYGVSRLDPDHLLAPDIETNQMKYSRDGGKTWQVDSALTSLVTANGLFQFRVGPSSFVQVIGFDPYDRCHILVGTAQNGVFRSTDRGISWTQVDGSQYVPNISSFYFPSDGSIVASSYGRGLWLFHVDRRQGCRYQVGPLVDERPKLFEIPGGRQIDFQRLGQPPICDGCQYIVVRYGRVIDVELEGDMIRRVVTSGGTVHQVDGSGAEVPLRIPNTFALDTGRFAGHAVLTRASQLGPIRALVVEGDRLAGVIVSAAEVPFESSRAPYVRVLSDNMIGGIARVAPGGLVQIVGQGFAPGVPVAITVGGTPVREVVTPNETGSFRVEVAVDRLPGDYEVIVEQQDGRRLTRDRSTVKVMLQDRRPGA